MHIYIYNLDDNKKNKKNTIHLKTIYLDFF